MGLVARKRPSCYFFLKLFDVVDIGSAAGTCAEAPKVDLSKLAGREIRVRAGEPIRVDVPVTGSPPPVVSWQKENKALEPSDRVSSSVTLRLQLRCLRWVFTSPVARNFSFEPCFFAHNHSIMKHILDYYCSQLAVTSMKFSVYGVHSFSVFTSNVWNTLPLYLSDQTVAVDTKSCFLCLLCSLLTSTLQCIRNFLCFCAVYLY